jgi:hypothetical protein
MSGLSGQGQGDVDSPPPFRRKACPEGGGTCHVTPTAADQVINSGGPYPGHRAGEAPNYARRAHALSGPAPVPSIRSTAPNTHQLSNPDFKIKDLLKSGGRARGTLPRTCRSHFRLSVSLITYCNTWSITPITVRERTKRTDFASTRGWRPTVPSVIGRLAMILFCLRTISSARIAPQQSEATLKFWNRWIEYFPLGFLPKVLVPAGGLRDAALLLSR